MLSNAATEIINQEIEGLKLLAANIPADFAKAVDVILNMRGRLIVSGMGKSGYIANKIAASVASTGTHSSYVHPAEASHGDLGMISKDDVVLLLSNSGETKELGDIISYCKRFHIPLIAMTMKPKSLLAESCNFLLNIPEVSEASEIAAPTTSAVMMLALGDALMVAIYESKGFTRDDFKLLHPGGKIGVNLYKVQDLMHIGNSLPMALETDDMSDVLITMTQKGFGVAAVADKDGVLVGVITDGDLRRHMHEDIVNKTAKEIMTAHPRVVSPSMLAIEALVMMNEKNITCLLVSDGKTLSGVIHIHDLLRAGVG